MPNNFRISCVEIFLSVLKSKRCSLIALYLAGKPQIAIVKASQNLNVNKSLMSRTIARYRNAASITKRYAGGLKKTAASSEMVRKLKTQIEQNSRRSGRKMAPELKISARSVQQILQNELKLEPLKFQKAQDLTPEQKKS